jgi:hypothetical protein
VKAEKVQRARAYLDLRVAIDELKGSKAAQHPSEHALAIARVVAWMERRAELLRAQLGELGGDTGAGGE